MKRQRTVLVAAIMTTMAVHADVINVPQGQSQDVSSSVTVTSMEVHGTLNIVGDESSPVAVTLDPLNLNVPLGSAVGDNAIINIGGYGRVSGGNFMFGGSGGVGGFVVGGTPIGSPQWNGENAHLATGQMTVAPDATSDSGVIDILTLNEGGTAGVISSVGRQGIVNRSKSVDARVVFNGGTFYLFNGFGNFLFTTDYDSRFPEVVKQGEGGKRIVCESLNDNPIRITYINGGQNIWPIFGKVCFRGGGDVILNSAIYENAASWNLQNTVTWEQSGDLVLSGSMGMTMNYWSILPNSAGNGIVQVVGNDKCFLNLNGYGQWVNGLIVGGDASLKNTASGPAELTLGSNRPDCVLSVKKLDYVGAIKAVKQGSGTLTVTNTPYFPEIQLKSGGVLFTSDDCTVGSFTAAFGTSVVVDGCTLALHSLKNDGASFTCKNGGRIIEYVGGNLSENRLVANGITSIVKNGAGTVVLHQNQELLSSVHVVYGTLTLAKVGTDNRWFRFTFTRMYNDYSLQLSEILLMNSAGERVVGALTDAPAECSLTDMPDGSIWANDQDFYRSESGYYSRPPSALFDGQTWTRVWYPTAPTDDKPKIFVVRVPSTAAEVYQYNFKNGYSGNAHPTAWKVETSPDGIDWTLSDSHSGVTPPSANGSYYNNGIHYPLMSGNDGAAGILPSANVRVDRGAVLDCSRVIGGQTLSNITVDCADGSGFGKIVNAVFASTGVIRIENMPDGMKRGYCELPLAFVDVSGAENLKEWTVIINGAEVSKRKAALQNGYLALMPSGLNIIVR